MSTTSNAIKTALFTRLVPLVVAGYVPPQMVDGSLARLLSWEVIGGLLVILGAIGYFWGAALFVKAQGTPAPIFPTKRAVVTGLYRLNRNLMYTAVLAGWERRRPGFFWFLSV